MKKFRAKRADYGLQVRTFTGRSGHAYIVFRAPRGSFHVFIETEAKAAAKNCGGKGNDTRRLWQSLWDKESD